MNELEIHPCPVPGCTGTLSQYFPLGETDFQLCSECGIVLRQPMPSIAELAELYGEHYRDENVAHGRTNQESNQYAVSAYAQYIERKVMHHGDRILDFGAGTGSFVSEWEARGYHCDGVEFSAAARSYAEKHRGVHLRSDSTGYELGQLDVITLIEVIEHLTAPWETLRSLRQLLKPGQGHLVITTPNRDSWRARKEKGYWHEARKKFHLVFYNKKSLSKMLRDCGFDELYWPKFPPVPKKGLKYSLAGRIYQSFGAPGTLFVIARARQI